MVYTLFRNIAKYAATDFSRWPEADTDFSLKRKSLPPEPASLATSARINC
jgi:hypothetical protein